MSSRSRKIHTESSCHEKGNAQHYNYVESKHSTPRNKSQETRGVELRHDRFSSKDKQAAGKANDLSLYSVNVTDRKRIVREEEPPDTSKPFQLEHVGLSSFEGMGEERYGSTKRRRLELNMPTHQTVADESGQLGTGYTISAIDDNRIIPRHVDNRLMKGEIHVSSRTPSSLFSLDKYFRRSNFDTADCSTDYAIPGSGTCQVFHSVLEHTQTVWQKSIPWTDDSESDDGMYIICVIYKCYENRCNIKNFKGTCASEMLLFLFLKHFKCFVSCHSFHKILICHLLVYLLSLHILLY
jgi:hypothetical protein